MWLQLETNTRCNAKCLFCPHPEMEKRPEMPDQMIKKILEEMVSHVEGVSPFLYQEPLMEPRLSWILELIKEINPDCITHLHTNAGLLTEEKAEELIQPGHLDGLFLSFYGPNEELYQKYQPGPDWKTTRENIIRFMAMRKGSLPRVHMHYLETPDLMEMWEQMESEWSDTVDDITCIHYETYGGLKPELTSYQGTMRRPCHHLWARITILSDGSLVPCCLDYSGSYVIGDAFTEDVMAIWNGERMEELRHLHQTGQWDKLPELCRNCTLWRGE